MAVSISLFLVILLGVVSASDVNVGAGVDVGVDVDVRDIDASKNLKTDHQTTSFAEEFITPTSTASISDEPEPNAEATKSQEKENQKNPEKEENDGIDMEALGAPFIDPKSKSSSDPDSPLTLASLDSVEKIKDQLKIHDLKPPPANDGDGAGDTTKDRNMTPPTTTTDSTVDPMTDAAVDAGAATTEEEMASTPEAAKETKEEDSETTGSIGRHRKLTAQTDWLTGNTRMYGPRETASLADGWAAANDFCHQQGGSLATAAEICPPDGNAAKSRPLFGIHKGGGGSTNPNNWVPVGNRENQWINIGDSATYPTCTFHGGAGGSGHVHGWANFIVCRSNWFKYKNVKATDVGAGADGALWVLTDYDHDVDGRGCYGIKRHDGNDSWTTIGGCALKISVGSSAHIVLANHHGDIYKYGAGGWGHLPGQTARDISVTADGSMWITKLVSGYAYGDIYRKLPTDASFVHYGTGGDRITGLGPNKIAQCSFYGGQNHIYIKQDGGSWYIAGTCDGGDVSYATDGTLWTTAAVNAQSSLGQPRKSFSSTATATKWALPVLGPSGGNIAAVSANKFFMVDSNNDLWKYEIPPKREPNGITRVFGPTETANIKSFDQAQQFCESQGGSLASSADVCPLDGSNQPFFGIQAVDQWTPVSDYHNAWIQVGTHGSNPPCISHRDIANDNPAWGLDGSTKVGPEANYVVCNMKTSIYGPSYTSNVNSYAQAQDFCLARGETLASISDICPPGSSGEPYFGIQSGDQWTPVSDYDNAWLQVGVHSGGVCKTHKEVASGADPSWGTDASSKVSAEANFIVCVSSRVLYGKSETSALTTYDQATNFCNSKGESLASIADVCPFGTYSLPYFGIESGDQWTPVSDYNNAWVQVGVHSDGVCRSHREIAGADPAWGLDGSHSEAANYIVCTSRWKKFHGITARDVGAAKDGTIWVIGTNDKGGGCYGIWKHEGNDTWVEVDGCGVRISVGNSTNVIMVGSDGKISKRSNNDWVQVTTALARDASITEDGTIWMTELVPGQDWGDIKRKRLSDTDFVQYHGGGGGDSISGLNADQATVCNSVTSLATNLLWVSGSSSWYQAGSCDNGDVSYASDGTIWTTGQQGAGSTGVPRRSTTSSTSGTTWDTAVEGGATGRYIAAVNANRFLLIDSNNTLWEYEIPETDDGWVNTGTSTPSSTPSISPSGVPSASPSRSPSIAPSESPSISPSYLPTGLPSTSPSNVPSITPSISPSALPSQQPSDRPSLVPSLSSAPSAQPSSYPSALPSISPSLAPSSTPSDQPTSTPTYAAFASNSAFASTVDERWKSEWGSLHMFGPQETNGLAIGWTAAQEFCNSQGGKLASKEEICPSTTSTPVDGIQTPDNQWAPISDGLNKWINVGQSDNLPACSRHGGAAPENIGQGHAQGWGNYVYCAPNDWYQFKGISVRDVDAAEDGTIWVISSTAVMTDCYSIHRYVSGDTWEEVRGCANRVSVGSSTNVVIVTTDGEIHQWTGRGWKLLTSPPARYASISKDGTIWMSKLVSGTDHGDIYRKLPSDNDFKYIIGGGSDHISGSGPDWVASCNSLASLSQNALLLNGGSGWYQVGTCDNGDVSIATDGTIWTTGVPSGQTSPGLPRRSISSSAAATTWDLPIQGKSCTQIVAIHADMFLLVDSGSNLWQYKVPIKMSPAADAPLFGPSDTVNVKTYEEAQRFCQSKGGNLASSRDICPSFNNWQKYTGFQATDVGAADDGTIMADVSITKDGYIWIIEKTASGGNGAIKRKHKDATTWEHIDAGFGHRISAFDVNHVVTVALKAGGGGGGIIYYNMGTGWHAMGECENGDVDLATDETVWTTGGFELHSNQVSQGLARSWNGHDLTWDPALQGHTGTNIAAVSAREFLMVDDNDNLWHYKADHPYFGIQTGDQWTPVSDYDNAWIQVGIHPSGGPTCALHREIANGADPTWGLDGSWPDAANHILCNMDKFVFGPSDTFNVTSYDDAKHFCEAKGGALAPFDDICPVPAGVNRPYFGAVGGVHWTPHGDYRNGWVEVGGDAETAMCSRHRTKYGDPRIGLGPVWGVADDKLQGEADYVVCKMEGVYLYGPDVTANVKSYDQAKQFCEARQLLLASSADICPQDGSNKPYFGIQPDDQWTPVSDYHNGWLQVGTHVANPLCSSHRDINNDDPAWGLDGSTKVGPEANFIVCSSWFHLNREETTTEIGVSGTVFEQRQKLNKLYSIPDHHLHGRISRSIARFNHPDGKQRNLCAYAEDGFNFPYTLAYYKVYPEEGSLEIKYATNLQELYTDGELRIARPSSEIGYFPIGDVIWNGGVNTTKNGTDILIPQKKALLVKGSGSALTKPLYYQNIFNASIGYLKETGPDGLPRGGSSETNGFSSNGTKVAGGEAAAPTFWHEYNGISVRDVGAAHDGTIWVISNYTVMEGCYSIHRLVEGDNWEEVRGCASGISVGSRENVIVTTTDGEIFKWSSIGWDLIPSPAARDATISRDGTIFLTELKDGTDYGDVWRKHPSDSSFVFFGGGGDRIAASGPDKVALCNSLPSINQNALWVNAGSGWYPTGACENGDVSIAADGTIWTTGSTSHQTSPGLARKSIVATGSVTTWATPIQGHSGGKIAAMSATEFVLVDSKNKLWRYENPGLQAPKTGSTRIFGPRETGPIKSYREAQKFCEIKGGSLASSSDICPSGSSSWPYFGIQDGEQWAPVSDFSNGWIQLGSHPFAPTCSLYRDTHDGMDPDWGLDGTSKKAWESNYIACSMRMFMYGPSSTAGVKTYDQAQAFCAARGGTLPSSTDICPSANTNSWNEEWGDIHMFGPNETSSLAIGWTAAEEFCSANGGSLSAIHEICPPGGNSTPVTGVQSVGDDQWAPISERENQWVNVGSGGIFSACTKHGGAAPEITGEGRDRGWGNYVFCSAIRKGWFKYSADVRDVGAAEDGTIWAIGMHDYFPGKGCYSILRNSGGDSWAEVGGCSHRISVGSSSNIVVLNFHGHIHQWTGHNWKYLHSPPARDVSITKDGTIWMTELHVGHVYRKLPMDPLFAPFGGYGDRIDGSSPDKVALCNSMSDQNLLWVHGGSHWYPPGACENGDISVAADGTIWTTGIGNGQTGPGLARKSMTSSDSATTWAAPIQGPSGRNIAAVNAYKFLLVDASNQLWEYEEPAAILPTVGTLKGGDQWIPFNDYHNGWIEIGRDENSPVCSTIRDVHGDPQWGLVEDNSVSGPNYLVCDLNRVIFGPSETTSVTSYNQAQEFCKAKGGYLASSSEICPLGASSHWINYEWFKARDIAAAEDGTMWAIGIHDYWPSDGCYSIHRRHGKDSWHEIGGCAHRISVGSKDNVIVLNFRGDIFQWTSHGWIYLNNNPKARDASITKDGTIWITTLVEGSDHGAVYRKLANETSFREFAGGTGDRIAGFTSDKVAVCNSSLSSESKMWYYDSSQWSIIGDCGDGDISIAADGTVWTTGDGNNQTIGGLARRSTSLSGSGATWASPIQGHYGKNIAAVSAREFLMIDDNFNLWHYYEAEDPYFGIQSGNQWTPVSDYINAWVQVGSNHGALGTTCGLHRDTNRIDPRWGADGSWSGAANYVVCNMRLEVYDSISTINVKTYAQAQAFCTARGGTLASSADVCPFGPKEEPYFGIQTGDQWTPVADYNNAWVQVGVHPWGAVTCGLHKDAANHDPSWGLDGSRKDAAANHIVCKTGPPPEKLVVPGDDQFHMFPDALADGPRKCFAFTTTARENQCVGISTRPDLVQEWNSDFLIVSLNDALQEESTFYAADFSKHSSTNHNSGLPSFQPPYLDGTAKDFWVCSQSELTGGLLFVMGTGRDPDDVTSTVVVTVSLPDVTADSRPFFGFKSLNTEELYTNIEVIDFNTAPTPTPAPVSTGANARRLLMASYSYRELASVNGTIAPTTISSNDTNSTNSPTAVPSSSPTATPPSLWRPIPPPGYTCLGHVWSTDDKEPSTDLVRCIQTMFVEGSKEPRQRWDSQSSIDFDELTLWEATETRTSLSPGTFISRACEACESPQEEFYSLKKQCIVGHGQVPFCAEPGTPWKVEVANQTNFNIPYAKLQPCGYEHEDKRVYGRQHNTDQEWEKYAVELYNKSGFVGWKHLGVSERLGKPYCLGSTAFGSSTFQNDLFITNIPMEGRVLEKDLKNITYGTNGELLSAKLAGDFVFLFPCIEQNPILETKKMLLDLAAEASMDGSVESGIVNIEEDLGVASRHCNPAKRQCKAKSPWGNPHICGEKEEPTKSGASKCHRSASGGICGEKFRISVQESTRTLGRAIPYGVGQDGGGKYLVLDEGKSVLLIGNAWKAFSLGSEYTVTESTTLEFDFEFRNETEGHAICLDEDTNDDVEIEGQHRCFKLAGTQVAPSWSEVWKMPQDGEERTSWKDPTSKLHYKIKVGSITEGPASGKPYIALNTNMRFLALVQDNDADTEAGLSRFSNIKLYDAQPAGGTTSLATSICTRRTELNGLYSSQGAAPAQLGASTETMMRYNDGSGASARESLCPVFDAYSPTEIPYTVQAYNMESTDFLDVQYRDATEDAVYWIHSTRFRVLRVADTVLPDGYYRLGDSLNTNFANKKSIAIVKGGGDALAPPNDYIGSFECMFNGWPHCIYWRPVCPYGYVAMGYVWTSYLSGWHKPTRDYMRCVKEDYVFPLHWVFGLQWGGNLFYGEVAHNFWPQDFLLTGTHDMTPIESWWAGDLFVLRKPCTQYGTWPYCSGRVSMWPDDEVEFHVPYAVLKPCDFHDEHKELYDSTLDSESRRKWESTAVELYKDPITGFTGYKHIAATRRYNKPYCLGTKVYGRSNQLRLKYMPHIGSHIADIAHKQIRGNFVYDPIQGYGGDYVFLFPCSTNDDIGNHKRTLEMSRIVSSTIRRDLVNKDEDLGVAASYPSLSWSKPHFCPCGEEPIKDGSGCMKVDTCYYKASICPDEVKFSTCAADYSYCQCDEGYVGNRYGAQAVTSGNGDVCVLSEDADTQQNVSFDSFDVVMKKSGLTGITVRMDRYDASDPDELHKTVKKWDAKETTVVAVDAPKNIYKQTFDGLRPGTKYQYTITETSSGSVLYDAAEQVTYCCCDCKRSSQHDDSTGRPVDIKIFQDAGVITFEFIDNSRCSEAYAFTRTDVGAGEFIKSDESLKQTFTPNFVTFAKKKCTMAAVKPGTNAADDLRFSRLQVSEPYRYCIRAVAELYSADSQHSSDDACKIHFVRWQASIKGKIVTEQGKVPVEGVKVTWQLMNLQQTAVIHEGTATTKKPGKFQIEFDVDDSINKYLNRDNAFPVRITFDKQTDVGGSEPIIHDFVCEDGTVDCSGEDGTIFYLKHLEFNEPFMAQDKTSVPVKGRVSITEHGGCPLIGADVCLMQKRANYPDAQGACVKTDGSGNFQVPATIGTTVGVKVAYFEHNIVRAPENVLDYEKGIFIDPTRRYVGNDFVDIQKAALFVEIAGGLCDMRLGRSKIEVETCSSHPPLVLPQGMWKAQHTLPAHVLNVRVVEVRDDRDKEKPPQKLHDITKFFMDKTQSKSVDLREEVAKDTEEEETSATPNDQSVGHEQQPGIPMKDVPELRFQYDGALQQEFEFGGADELALHSEKCSVDKVLPEPLVKRQAGTTYSLHVTHTGWFFEPKISLKYELMTDMYCDVMDDDIIVEIENSVGIDAKWDQFKKDLPPDEVKAYERCSPKNTCKYSVEHSEPNGVKQRAHVAPKDPKDPQKKIKFLVGRPRIDSPYRKQFKVKVTKAGVRLLTHVAEVVITGDYKLGSGKSFALPTYNPILVLRDPPGGLSQASYENVQTTMRVRSAEYEKLSDVYHTSRLHLGADIDAGSCAGLGLQFCFKTFAVSGDGLAGGMDSDDIDYKYHNEHMFTSEYTTTWSYTTSDDPMLAGQNSDVFVVPNLNVLFSETLNFKFHPETCSTNVTTETKFNLEDKKNKPAVSFLSYLYIDQHLMPTLVTKVKEYDGRWKNEPDPQNKTKLKSQHDTLAFALQSWNQTIRDYMNTTSQATQIPAREWFDKWASTKDDFFAVDPVRPSGNPAIDLVNLMQSAYLTEMKPVIGKGEHWANLAPETLTDRAVAVQGANYIEAGSQNDKKDLKETNRLQFSGGGGTMEYSMGHSGITEMSRLNHRHPNEESTFGGTVSFDMSAGPGVMIGGGFELTSVTTKSQQYVDTDGNSKETTVSFVLGDEDKDDDFVVDIFVDPMYGTFIFQKVAGTTSAPWEGEPTARGEDIDLNVVQRPNKPVLPDEPMTFTLTIANNVNDPWTSAFVVFLDHTTNPEGLSHKLGGNDLAVAHDFGPFNGVRVVTMEVWRPSRGYQFPATLIQMQADWDDIGREAKTVWLHNSMNCYGTACMGVEEPCPCIKFEEPCPAMEWAGPFEQEKKYVVNLANVADPVPLVIRNPKKADGTLASLVNDTRLESVFIYWRKLGETSSPNIACLDVSKQQRANFAAIPVDAGREDGYGYASINWFFQQVHVAETSADGVYEVFVESRCQGFTNAPDNFIKVEPEPLLIVVDRVAPKMYGMLPVRDVVVPGEEVVIVFTEEIDCSIPFNFDLTVSVAGIKDAGGVNDAKYGIFSNDLNIDCRERKLGFLFDELMGYDVLMGREMSISVTGIHDLQGNNITEAIQFKKTFANLNVNNTGSAFDMTLGEQCNGTTMSSEDAKVRITQLLNLADSTRIEILSVRCENANQTLARVKMAPSGAPSFRKLEEGADTKVDGGDHTPIGVFYALAQLSKEARERRRLTAFNVSSPDVLIDLSGNPIDFEFSVGNLELIPHESDVERYSLDDPPSTEEQLIVAVAEGIDETTLRQREQILRLEQGMKQQLAATAAMKEQLAATAAMKEHLVTQMESQMTVQTETLHAKMEALLDRAFDKQTLEKLPNRERRNSNRSKLDSSSNQQDHDAANLMSQIRLPNQQDHDAANLMSQIRLLQVLFGCSVVAIIVLQYKKNQLKASLQQ
ncbi:Cupin superfamily protein [Seminavis robusta]|uniref:Circumsporozoite protein n=1 Tax=Seminavis robusta TaxID=568900 RepID=A0A9N8E6Z2_9STRA|nr:Cupin superfamily protein [Seminavis robusta]|eukprot:Sro689_g187500.1 Cupin superfamily protein (6920) ;mRNA; r:2615-27489